ncbi:MAG: arylsulfatase [Fuerstiella sp.]|nr:arylsulfatase [Fuerstiella sp.]MCP4854916.1 arylsulfatase [Fuerstiella sp.]
MTDSRYTLSLAPLMGLCLLTAFPCASLKAAPQKKPNVILIITDDQGYGDIGAHGNALIQTPNMDQLHAESVRFTNFHVDPTCSPTRGALMSGKYSHRARVWHTIAGGNHLRANEITMADVFRASGYRTGMFGKWHLGSNYPYRPIDRGFDEWLGQGDGGTGTTDDYFTNDRVNDHYLHNGAFEFRPGYAPDVFYDAAIDYIRDKDDDGQPFFVYLSTYIPHNPHTLADRGWADKYMPAVDPKVAYFFAAIERVDQGLGRLRKTLQEEGLAEDTILIFMTDNGGTAGVDYFNAGMRGRKGSPYEGGHRTPFLVHWKKGKLGHGRDVADLTAHFDVLPTVIDLLDLKLPAQADFDGRSFKEQLYQPEKLLPERTICVEVQRTFEPRKWRGATAMTRRWRLVNGNELYDIQADPGQKHNVLSDHSEVAEKLNRSFDTYWQHVSPGDRDRVVFVVGHEKDSETYLQSMDWYAERVPWNHAATSRGVPLSGSWRIKAAKVGTYRFELRRWPKEVDAPITGIPQIAKTIDAWDSSGGKATLLYTPNTSTPFKVMPVAAVRLEVGDKQWVKPVDGQETHIAFDIPLNEKEYEVTAELLDSDHELLAGAYYIYCHRID